MKNLANWEVWLKGLISAYISGSATAISTMIVAPDKFNLQNGLSRLITVSMVSGILSAANFLKQSPLPNNQVQNPKIQ